MRRSVLSFYLSLAVLLLAVGGATVWIAGPFLFQPRFDGAATMFEWCRSRAGANELDRAALEVGVESVEDTVSGERVPIYRPRLEGARREEYRYDHDYMRACKHLFEACGSGRYATGDPLTGSVSCYEEDE